MNKTIRSISHKCYKNKVSMVLMFGGCDTKLSFVFHRKYITKLTYSDMLYDTAEQILIEINRDYPFIKDITTRNQMIEGIMEAIKIYF